MNLRAKDWNSWIWWHFLVMEVVKTWEKKIGLLSCGTVKSCLGCGAVSYSESIEEMTYWVRSLLAVLFCGISCSYASDWGCWPHKTKVQIICLQTNQKFLLCALLCKVVCCIVLFKEYSMADFLAMNTYIYWLDFIYKLHALKKFL